MKNLRIFDRAKVNDKKILKKTGEIGLAFVLATSLLPYPAKAIEKPSLDDSIQESLIFDDGSTPRRNNKSTFDIYFSTSLSRAEYEELLERKENTYHIISKDDMLSVDLDLNYLRHRQIEYQPIKNQEDHSVKNEVIPVTGGDKIVIRADVELDEEKLNSFEVSGDNNVKINIKGASFEVSPSMYNYYKDEVIVKDNKKENEEEVKDIFARTFVVFGIPVITAAGVSKVTSGKTKKR